MERETFDMLWDAWLLLAEMEAPEILLLNQFKDRVYNSLQTAESKDERKNLSSLLATVQNKIWGNAKKESSRDTLAQVLASVPIPSFLR